MVANNGGSSGKEQSIQKAGGRVYNVFSRGMKG